MAELRDYDRSAVTDLEALQDRIETWTRSLKRLFKTSKRLQDSPGERSLRNTVHAWAVVECKGAADPVLVERDSYNVTAVTRTSTGLYDFTIKGYSQNIAVIPSVNDQSTECVLGGGTTGKTNMRVLCNDNATTAQDIPDGVFLNVIAVGY